MLDYNQEANDSFYLRGHHTDSVVHLLSQSHFGARKNNKIVLLLQQTLTDVKIDYRHFVGFDMSYD